MINNIIVVKGPYGKLTLTSQSKQLITFIIPIIVIQPLKNALNFHVFIVKILVISIIIIYFILEILEYGFGDLKLSLPIQVLISKVPRILEYQKRVLYLFYRNTAQNLKENDNLIFFVKNI